MRITWLGTAGFEIKSGKGTIYTDPFLSRNAGARPVLKKSVNDIDKKSYIFLSHGHFDHFLDIEQILRQSNAQVFCADLPACILNQKKIPVFQIHPVKKDNLLFSLPDFKARALFSRHVRFDFKLVLSTLARINTKVFSLCRILKNFPCGQVLAWRFYIEQKTILFFGSAGCREKELEKLAKKPVDILLLSLQGHSDILDIGLHIVKKLKPKIVIPHHFDDFYPPLSRTIDVRPFTDYFKSRPDLGIKILVPKINVPIEIASTYLKPE